MGWSADRLMGMDSSRKLSRGSGVGAVQLGRPVGAWHPWQGTVSNGFLATEPRSSQLRFNTCDSCETHVTSISWSNPFVSHSRQSWRGVDNCCKLSINPNCNPNSLYFRAKCFVVTVTGSGFGEGKELLSFCSWEGPSFCSKQFGAPWRRWRGRKMSRRLRE